MATQKAKTRPLEKGLRKIIKLCVDNDLLLKTSHIETAFPKMAGKAVYFNGTEDGNHIAVCFPWAVALTESMAITTTEVTETSRPGSAKSVFTLEAIGDLHEVSIDGNKTELFLVTECVDMKKDRPIRKLH
jgi:hypothetical protein